MVVRSRFEEVIHEANDLDSPASIRHRELHDAIARQWIDQMADLYDQIDNERYHIETMLMTKEMWDMLVQDPEFGNNEGK